MESSAAGECIPHKSKKRVFPEISSGTGSKEDAFSSAVNRNVKGKNKMHKQNEDTMVSTLSWTNRAILKEVKSRNKGINISPTLNGVIKLDLEDSDSYNGKNYIDLSSDAHDSEYKYPITGMESSNPQPSMVDLRTRLDTVMQKNKGVKTSFNPAKVTNRISGSSSSTCPSLRLQRCEMKVRSVKKPVNFQLPKMPSGSGQITCKENVTLEKDSGNNEEVLRKYSNFKKFDIVEDYSDHHYKGANSESMQPPGNWSKKIQKEWKILEKDLPDTIFVRVYESRMDLLRAVIIGAEGTPYHDGLFFFDVHFPNNYPAVPPKVYYHSGGLRINPNIYGDGKVCLSLLHTWIGDKNESWTPGVSTMLQVLVSIQGLILNARPYFNEPGFADSSGTDYGENQSMLYNERILTYSLKTMGYAMKNPPKHFEDLVIGHFRERGVDILRMCRSYVNGVGENKGSYGFGKNVERCMGTIVEGFKGIGVENLDEFVPQSRSLAQKIWDFFGF